MPSDKTGVLYSLYEKEPELFKYGVIALVLAAIAGLFVLSSGGASGLGQCNGILLSSYRDACISKLAIASSNYTLCGGLPSQYSDGCFTAIAENTNNQELCARLSSSEASYNCVYAIANRTGSYSACASLGEPMQDGCLTSLAVQKSDGAECQQITNSSAATVCRYSVELNSALNENRPGMCNRVTNSTNSSLTAQIAAYSGVYQYGTAKQNASIAGILAFSSSQPISYLQFLPNVTYSARDLCYLYFASSTENASYCGNVSSRSVANLCNESVRSQLIQGSGANATGQPAPSNSMVFNALGNFTTLPPAFCANLSLSEGACNAFSKMYNAVTTRNVSACASLAGLYQYQCYASLARAYQNSTYCSYISNVTANGACVQEVYNTNVTG